jgi:hypothetical protein
MVIITNNTNRIDKQTFSYAYNQYASLQDRRGGASIGTLSEKSLHAVLKLCYEPDTDRHEINVGSFVADIVGEDGIIEIQTRGLSRLKPKLAGLSELCRVTIVHPIIADKRIISLDGETGQVISIRKSPKHGTLFGAVRELYTLRNFLPGDRLTLRLPVLVADEYRTFGVKTNRRKKQRRRGEEYISDIIPTDIIDEIILRQSEDYAVFIPEGLPSPFSSSDFAAAAQTDVSSARMTINLLMNMNLAARTERPRLFRLTKGS